MNKREFLKTSLVAVGGLGLLPNLTISAFADGNQNDKQKKFAKKTLQVNKREKLLSVLDQSKPNRYVPAAFFMHFNEKFGQPAVQRHIEYFRATNMDMMKVQYELSVPKLDIKKAEDWAKVPVYGKDFFEPELALIEVLAKELKSETMILPTVYCPFNLALQTLGFNVVQHAKENPDAVAKGLQNLTESVLIYVREAIKRGADGFYYSTQGGDSKHFAETDLFKKLIAASDMPVLQEISDNALLNILHICDYESQYNEILKFRNYPASIINPPFELKNGDRIRVKNVQEEFHRPVMGGLYRHSVISGGNFNQIQPEIDNLMHEAPQNFILAADCTVHSDWQTLRQVIDYAHDWREKH
ncbi:MAG: hypothetical protein LBS50_01360 [Prevotellaceae bacterium]|nr:hypothetical protein [Prevotellaceae bacterium]